MSTAHNWEALRISAVDSVERMADRICELEQKINEQKDQIRHLEVKLDDAKIEIAQLQVEVMRSQHPLKRAAEAARVAYETGMADALNPTSGAGK